MKANLYFCTEGHAKPVLAMIGTGSPYAVHTAADGKAHKATAILRDVELGEVPKAADGKPDPAAYKSWHAALEAKHGPAALKAAPKPAKK